MHKYTAVIIGKDFVKEEEVSGAMSITRAQQVYASKWPGASVTFHCTDESSYIELDYYESGVWNKVEMSIVYTQWDEE